MQDLINLLKHLHSKGTSQWKKKTALRKKKKQSANQGIMRLFISKICKQLVLSKTHTTHEKRNWGKDLHGYFFQEGRQVAVGQVKRCSTRPIIREREIVSKWSIPSFWSEWPSSRRPAGISATKSRGKGIPLQSWWGCKSLQEWWETAWTILQELNIWKPHDYSNPPSGLRCRKKEIKYILKWPVFKNPCF